METLAAMSLEEFLAAPFELWARYAVESGRVPARWKTEASGWLREFQGSYGTEAAKEAFRATDMAWHMEWSSRTWDQIRNVNNA
jgi:hypothetical protein